jgi:elongation factor P
MNTENYEQLTFAKELINAPDFLVDGMMCYVLFHASENRAMAVELPRTVNLKVTYSEPTVKGNTSSNAMKTVTVEGGAEVAVPLFIKTDEEIVINTEDGSYKSARNRLLKTAKNFQIFHIHKRKATVPRWFFLFT